MASRIFEALKVLGKVRVDITGSFQPNGVLAPANQYGNGFKVARTSAGLYTVTFSDPYSGYDSAWCEVESATLGQCVQISAEPDVKVNQTLLITAFIYPTLVAADVAFNANTRIHFGIRMKNTSGNW